MAEFESDRAFMVWSFSASHRVLFLRSNPNRLAEVKTRIEIYIGHVEVMLLRSRMEGLGIWQPSAEEEREVANRFGLEIVSGYLYLISSEGFTGFIVGGRPSWREAAREIGDPALFDFGEVWRPGPEDRWGDVTG